MFILTIESEEQKMPKDEKFDVMNFINVIRECAGLEPIQEAAKKVTYLEDLESHMAQYPELYEDLKT